MKNRHFSSSKLGTSQQQDLTEPCRSVHGEGTKPSILWSAILRDDTILAEADLGGGVLYEVHEAAQLLLKKPPTPGWEHVTLHRQRVLGTTTTTHSRGPGSWFENASSVSSIANTASTTTDKLKGMKFHVFEHCGVGSFDEEEQERQRRFLVQKQQQQQQGHSQRGENFQIPSDKSKHRGLTIWTFACVYDPSLVDMIQVQSFLEKMVTVTEIFRQPTIGVVEDDRVLQPNNSSGNDNANPFSSSYQQQRKQQPPSQEDLWRYGSHHAVQDTFAPILLQRMEEVSYYGKMAMCHERLDAVKAVMARNIDLILENDERIEVMANQKAAELNEMAKVFAKSSKKVKRQMLWNNAKHGALLGAAITAGVAVVVVPPLVAIL